MEESQSQFAGRIVLERITKSRPIRSFIRKKIVAWLEAHGISPTDRPTYQIALNKTSYGHWFTCRIEVHSQGSHWEAMITEPDLHQSILSALSRLHPKERVYVIAHA